jgi:hypothetical protein
VRAGELQCCVGGGVEDALHEAVANLNCRERCQHTHKKTHVGARDNIVLMF